MPTVTLDRLHKRFGETIVIEDFSLEIADGELVVLVGGSGSGKSTILRMLAGLETPTSGSIRIGGLDVTALAPKDRDVAMVFQDYALYPHMTVRENLSLGLRLRKMARAEIDRRIAWAAGLLGLDALLDRKPKALSGGQRQRVAMGRAMVREPSVFLFDEPLSNLDASLRAQMRIQIGTLQRRLGTTTVYVTHDQIEAMTLGDRIVVLADGRIQQVGRPIELYERPVNRFVAGFIGTPPMNFLEGTVVEEAAGRAFVSEGARIPWLGEAAARATPAPALTLGVRPEDLQLSGGERDITGGPRLDGRVVLVERLGGSNHVHFEVGTRRMMVSLGNVTLPGVGDTITLYTPPGRMHWFDAEGRRLSV